MADTEKQKQKLLHLAKIFYERTDAEHQLTIPDLIRYLAEEDIHAERKALYRDIETLTAFGLPICKQKTKEVGYYLAERTFEVADLALIANLLKTSPYVSQKRRLKIENQLESLTPIHNRRKIRRKVCLTEKPINIKERVYANMELLQTAIEEKRHVTFRYKHFVFGRNNRCHREELQFEVSPYLIAWADSHYYLIGSDANGEDALAKFNIERISNIVRSEKPFVDYRIAAGDLDFDLEYYTKGIFSTDDGTASKVVFEFHQTLFASVADKFPPDSIIQKTGEDRYLITTETDNVPHFLSWILRQGSSVKLVSPAYLVSELENLSRELYTTYCKHSQ